MVNFSKMPGEILIGTVLKQEINLRRIDILTILSLPIHGPDKSLHLWLFTTKSKLVLAYSFYCTLLYCASEILCFFYKLKVCGNPLSSKSTGTIFPKAFAHFVPLCHILVILTMFLTFSLLLYLLWWSVISVLWCYYCKKIMTRWGLRWWLALFSNKFLIKVCTFLDVMILHT